MNGQVNWIDIVSVLLYIAWNGGAGLLAYLFWNELEQIFPKVAAISSHIKRYVTLTIGALFGWGAVLALMWFGVHQVPMTPQEWVSMLFGAAAVSVISSQAIHGREKLKGS